MHLVSQVEGKLATGRTAIDVIAATFPGGTITGVVRTLGAPVMVPPGKVAAITSIAVRPVANFPST
jgi:hypothetical protein